MHLDRDLREAIERLSGQHGALIAVKKHAFWLIAKVQSFVDYPTWLGAYQYAQDKGMSEALSVQAADRAVRLSQMAGGQKDLAAIQRNKGVMRWLTMGTHYSVTLTASGGNVKLNTALASGERLVIQSAMPLLQPLDLQDGGGFYPHVLNDAHDRHCMQTQQLAETLSRAVKVPPTSDLTPEQMMANLQADIKATETRKNEAAASAAAASTSKPQAATSATQAATSATQAATSATNW